MARYPHRQGGDVKDMEVVPGHGGQKPIVESQVGISVAKIKEKKQGAKAPLTAFKGHEICNSKKE